MFQVVTVGVTSLIFAENIFSSHKETIFTSLTFELLFTRSLDFIFKIFMSALSQFSLTIGEISLLSYQL